MRTLVIGALACALSVSACSKVGDQTNAGGGSARGAGTRPRRAARGNPALAEHAQPDPVGLYDRGLLEPPLVRQPGQHRPRRQAPHPDPGRRDTDRAKRRDQQGRADDHLPSALRRAVARRRRVQQQGRQVHLASDDEQREQRERARRLRRRVDGRYAERHDGRVSPQAQIRAVREHDLRRERQPGLRPPRAPARQVREPQPDTVQPATDRNRAVQGCPLGARRPYRVRRERRLLPRQAQTAPHHRA